MVRSVGWTVEKLVPQIQATFTRLKEGDIGVVISEEHQHDYAKLGTEFQILKVINDLDYYGVLINNKLEYIGGFRLVSI